MSWSAHIRPVLSGTGSALWRCGRWALGLVLVALALLLAAGLALHWAILPHIDDWRPALEQQASKALGVKVRIGRIGTQGGGLVPALDLQDVRLIDPRGREALRLPRISARLSLSSLPALELRFAQLLLERPELLLRRDAQGRITIGGLSMEGGGDAEATEQAADWFFQQHEFIIVDGRVRWQDEQRQAPTLELGALNLVVRNGLRRHELRLDATPGAAWGQRFSLRGRFTQSLLKRPGAVQHWSGQLFADLPRTDVRELRRYVDLPFELREGDGALRAWLDLDQGRPSGLTLDMGLRSVRLRVAPDLPELRLSRIGGRLSLQREAQRFSVQARQLGFTGEDGMDWPHSDWSFRLNHARGDTTSVTGGEIDAQQLDLALAAQIMERLPLAQAQRELIKDMAPTGRLKAVRFAWDGPLAAPRRYSAKGLLEGLSVRAEAAAEGAAGPGAHAPVGRPGLSGAQLQFDANEQGGHAALRIQQGHFAFPGVFEDPQLPLDQLRAALEWKLQPQPNGVPRLLELRLPQIQVANADLRGELELQWRATERALGRLELSGRLDEVRATRVVDYLPLGVGFDARHYVRHAVRGGTAHKVQMRVSGDLQDFPFDKPGPQGQKGVFRISTLAQDVTLAYVPSHPEAWGRPAYQSPWPEMEQVQAELVFERAGMSIRNGRARLMGVELNGVRGAIPDMGSDHPVLEIEGQGRAPLADLLRFIRSSPVGEYTGHALAQASGSGPAALKLALKLPLNHPEQSALKGQVQLAGNELRITPTTPLLTQARGRIEFDQKSVQLRGGQARALGGDISIEGASHPDGSLRFSAQGQVSAEGLRGAPELGLTQRLAQQMSGQTPMRLELAVLKQQTELSISSSLQGLALDLPAPLRKPADDSLPLRIAVRALPAPNGTPREELRVELGTLLQAQYQRELPEGAEPRVLRGALALLDKLPDLPAQGVIARAQLGTLNLDAWQQLAQRLGPAGPGLEQDNPYVPGQLNLRAQALQLGGRTLNKLVAGLSREGSTWRASLDAEQLSGYAELRPGRPGNPGRVYARMARLAVPRSDADDLDQLMDQHPRSVPTLDIVIDDFELRGLRLGRLEVQAQQQAEAREWRLSKLQLKNPDATLSATGQWAPAAGQGARRTELDWRMEVADAGKLLERLGQGQVLRNGKGVLAGKLDWSGSPLSPDYASMNGALNLQIDAGQFLKAEPGVGRLLGVLSLQSLPRRLVLDFRDLFSQGFAFDGFAGDIRIAQGVAHSDNLKMRGLQAVVLMEGQADLARETQDLHVLVVPEINAGGAALAYAAINPAIGLGTFVAQWLLRKPLAAAGTEEFRITGSWSEPKVEQLQRRAGQAEAHSPTDTVQEARQP